MIWLEIISVRTATYEETAAALDLCKKIRAQGSTGQPIELRVYCSASYETDLSVHIRWNFNGKRHGKTALGLELSAALSKLGFVNHTLWMEVVPKGLPRGQSETPVEY